MAPLQRSTTASLSALIVLQAIMLGSLYAGVAPHPPATTPLFAIGPFIGASIAMALAAIIMGPLERSGRVLAILAVLAALVSFGPQKYFDPQFALIWPAVLSGQIAALAMLLTLIKAARSSFTEETPNVA